MKYKCPYCDWETDNDYHWKCEKCEKSILFCKKCNKYSKLIIKRSENSPENYAACDTCGDKKYQSFHVYKSSIYDYYNFAFKFVNGVHIPYPMYFENRTLPVGIIKSDIGDYINDFMYKGAGEQGSFLGTDWGTARAYKVELENKNECIVLSHETGLEVFLIAAGGFVGMEIAKYTLKTILEKTENRINKWWDKRKKGHWNPKEVTDDPLVVAIQIRTPNWEITLDGKFNEKDKERIFDHIEKIIHPKASVKETFTDLHDDELVDKILMNSKNIVKRT